MILYYYEYYHNKKRCMAFHLGHESENLRIITRNEKLTKKEAIIGYIYTSKLLFFLTLSSQDLVNEDLDGYSLEE